MRTLVLVVGLCLLETVVSYGSSASNPYDNVPYEFFYDKSGDPSSQVNSQSHDARPATSFDEASAAPSASADPESSSSAAPSEANPSAAVESFNVEAPSDEGSYYGGVNEAVNSATQAAPLEETLPETTASVEPVDTRVRIASVPQQPAENPIPPPPPTDAEVHEAATEDPSLQDPAFIDISVSTKDKPQEEDPFIELEKGKRKKTTSTRHSVDTPNQLNGDVSTASRARVPHQSVSPLLPDESLLVPFTHEAQPPSTSPDQGVPRESLQHDLLTKGSEGLPLASIDEISQPSAGLSSVADSPREILAVPQPSESAVFQSKDTASLTDSTALSEGSAGVESHTEQRIEVSLAQQVAPAELPHEIGRNPTIRGTPTDVQTADVVGFKEIVPDLVGDVKVKKDAEDISLPAGTSDRAATTSGEDDEYSDEEEDDDLSTTTEPAPDPVPVDTPTVAPIAPSVEQTEFAEELRTTQAPLPVESFIEPEAASGKKPCCACCKEVDLKSGLETGSDEVPKKLGFGTTAPKEAKRDLIPSAPLLPQLTATAAPPQPGGFSGPFQQAVQQQVSSFQSIPPNVGVGSGGSYAQQPTFQGNYFGGNTQEGNFVQAPVQSVPQGYPQGGYSQPLPQQGYAQAYQPAPNFAQQSYSVRPSYGPSYFGGGGGGGGCGGGGGGCGGGGGSGVRNLQFYPFGCGCPTPQPCCNLPSPCCLPQLPPLPCCPKIPCCSAPPTCCAPSTGCSRGCARSMARTARAKRQSCIPCFGRKKREIEEEQHWRQKRTCVPCLKRAKRQAQSNCRSCNNLGDLIRIGPTTNTRERRSITLSWCTVCNGRRKRQAEQCINRCQQRHKRQADAEDPEITNAVHVQPEKKKSLDFDETFQCDRSCCDYSKCQSLRAKKYFLF